MNEFINATNANRHDVHKERTGSQSDNLRTDGEINMF